MINGDQMMARILLSITLLTAVPAFAEGPSGPRSCAEVLRKLQYELQTISGRLKTELPFVDTNFLGHPVNLDFTVFWDHSQSHASVLISAVSADRDGRSRRSNPRTIALYPLADQSGFESKNSFQFDFGSPALHPRFDDHRHLYFEFRFSDDGSRGLLYVFKGSATDPRVRGELIHLHQFQL